MNATLMMTTTTKTEQLRQGYQLFLNGQDLPTNATMFMVEGYRQAEREANDLAEVWADRLNAEY